ncbi:MAG: hypothetical protein IK051_09840 [Rhodocyclaceae bacterium]|nr:hypothetical protein [Rhodocyclaceae bacterium]
MKPVAVAILLALCLSGCSVFSGKPASVTRAPVSEPWYPLVTCATPHSDDTP